MPWAVLLCPALPWAEATAFACMHQMTRSAMWHVRIDQAEAKYRLISTAHVPACVATAVDRMPRCEPAVSDPSSHVHACEICFRSY